MGCCGEQRRGLAPRTGAVPTTALHGAGAQPHAAHAPAPSARALRLRCRMPLPARVRGPATGRDYLFSQAQPVQAVEVRDAAMLLRTTRFARA